VLTDLFSTVHSMLTGLVILVTAVLAAGTANAITVDGNLADLISASADPNTGASASESGTDAENNGFDITNSYLFFDKNVDTLYVGFETTGPVGNGCAPTALGSCAFPFFQNSEFDSQESVSISLDIGTQTWAANDVQALIFGDGGTGTGPDNLMTSSIPAGVTVAWAVSELNNGVEFSIANLIGSGTLPQFNLANPGNIAVRLGAGSITHSGPEDEAFISAVLVPVPAAVWLFGSALAGLAGLRRHKQKFSHQ